MAGGVGGIAVELSDNRLICSRTNTFSESWEAGLIEIKTNKTYESRDITNSAGIPANIGGVNYFQTAYNYMCIGFIDYNNLDNSFSLLCKPNKDYNYFDPLKSVVDVQYNRNFSTTDGYPNRVYEIDEYVYVFLDGGLGLHIEKRLKDSPFTLINRIDLMDADVFVYCAEDYYKNGYFWIPCYREDDSSTTYQCYKVDADLNYNKITDTK
jgi:hypothetical protein